MIEPRVYLHRLGTTQEIEVTKYLNDEKVVTLTEWLEQGAFERKHGDIHLVLSNQNGFFSDLFAGTLGTTRWKVYLRMVSEVVWRGEIQNKSITFSLDSRWCEFDAFSNTKWFWEYAKTISPVVRFNDMGLWQQFEDASGYISIPNFFSASTLIHNLWRNSTLFTQVDALSYAERKIRGVTRFRTPTGNEGRLADLTVNLADLLRGMQIYYNAEFYIDHATGTLKMRRRSSVEGTPRNIDNDLCDDVEPTVQWLGDSKVDYIYTYSYLFINLSEAQRIPVYIEPPIQIYNQLNAGTHSWVVIGFSSNDTPIVSTMVLTVNLPSPGQGYTGWWFQLNVPSFPHPVVTKRKVYRRAPLMTDFRHVGTIEHNNPHVYEDRLGIQILMLGHVAPEVNNTFSLYRRYDETQGTWLDDIVDVGVRPEGIIFEANPGITFGGDSEGDNQYNTWAFFGKETGIQFFREDWIDWFRTKRRVRCKARGVDYKLNQLIESGRFPNDLTPSTQYSIRRIEANLMQQTSILELVSM